jgi:hypothetical protein
MNSYYQARKRSAQLTFETHHRMSLYSSAQQNHNPPNKLSVGLVRSVHRSPGRWQLLPRKSWGAALSANESPRPSVHVKWGPVLTSDTRGSATRVQPTATSSS